jgi:hypothetical protein
MEAVDRGHRDVDRRIEAERVVGCRQVVVDRLRHTDHLDALFEELGRRTEGVLAADGDQTVHPVRFEVRGDRGRSAVLLERIGSRGAQDRAAPRQDPPDLRHAERRAITLERSAPAVPVAHELMPVLADPLAHDRPDHGVQPWAIASSGENTDPHQALNLPRRPEPGGR